MIFTAWVLAAAGVASQPVEGHVVNALTGDGIPGVTVFLIRQDGGIASTVTTDSKGRFRVDAVQDGAYTAQYMDGVPVPRNFWPVPNSWDTGAQPSPFQVGSGTDPVRLEVKMQPIGKLSGRVLDPAGKPVPNANVWLLSGGIECKLPSCFGFPNQAKTNERGEYSVTDVRVPGAWLISATAPASWNPPEPRDDERLGWAQTFYPGVADSQSASEIIVRPGGDLWNLDIKLAAVPVHHVRGMVLDLKGDPVPKLSVSLGKSFGPILRQETKSDGAFEFAAVTDGEWRLSTTVKKDGIDLLATQWVRVKDEDLENVKLRLAAPFSIQGKVTFEIPEGVAAPKAPDVKIEIAAAAALLSEPRQNDFLFGEPNEEGRFTIEHIYPGPYLIQVLAGSPTAPYYLDSIRLGNHEALESDVPLLSDAQPVTVTYKLGGGTVRGTIETCGAARVFLVPQDPALRRGDFIRTTNCGQNGGFEFSAVRPAEYYGLAVAWGNPTPWYGPMLNEGLLRQATRVSVRGNESTSAEIRIVTR